MKNYFQVGFIIVFIFATILGVLVFSGAIPLGKDGDLSKGSGTVVLWGTVKAQIMAPLIEELNTKNETFLIKYEEKQEETFDQDLLEALAAGIGPDLFFLPDDLVYHYANKIVTIPYESYPVASFKNNFAGAGEVFLVSKGILALPLAIDPLVMYYNRNILDSNNIVFPPKDWDEFVDVVPLLTKKDEAHRIVKSAAAMGHFFNVAHAKDILATLFMQLGDRIVVEKDGAFTSVLNERLGLDKALRFYTDFADPINELYSWNRSFPNSREFFSTDDLAFYFGFASELESLINKNPNQNFLVAPMPQVKNAPFKMAITRVTGIALSSFSKNYNTTFIVAGQMATGDFAQKFANSLGIVPARRDLLTQIPKNPFSPTFYAAALYSRSWLDPSPRDTDNIFRTMIEAVLSNNMSPMNAIQDANAKLSLLLAK